MSGIKPLKRIDKNGKNRINSREKYDEKDDRYLFGIRLKKYKESQKQKGNKLTDNAIQEALKTYFEETKSNKKLYKDIIPTTKYINNWSNNQDIPANASIIIALGKILKKDGYGLDYLFGITDDEAPDMSMEYVSKYTGLSYDAIEHLKKLSSKYPDTLNDFLTSDFLDTIIDNTQAGRNLKYDVKHKEFDAQMSIFDYVSWYEDSLEHQKNNKNYQKSELVKSARNSKIREIASQIESLSDEKLNQDSMPAYKLLQIKATVRAKLEEYFSKTIPALESKKYRELLRIFNENIKPIENTPEYTEEYYNNVLVPLQESIAYSFDDSSFDDAIQALSDKYGYDNISIGKPENMG